MSDYSRRLEELESRIRTAAIQLGFHVWDVDGRVLLHMPEYDGYYVRIGPSPIPASMRAEDEAIAARNRGEMLFDGRTPQTQKAPTPVSRDEGCNLGCMGCPVCDTR